MFNTSGLTAADVAAVTGGNGRTNDGWGNDWWAIIILFALFASIISNVALICSK